MYRRSKRAACRNDNLPGWEYGKSRNASHYVPPKKEISVPKQFCRTKTLLLVFVISATSHFEHRRLIRRTWGSVARDIDIDIYFLLGKSFDKDDMLKMQHEGNKNSDIIVANLLDTYNNLTIKSITMLRTVVELCTEKPYYVMKIDDDSLLNTAGVIELLRHKKRHKVTTNLMLGDVLHDTGPVRDCNKEWFLPYYLYEADTYPAYLAGAGYIMSVDVIEKLYKVAFRVNIVPMEDVFITGILRQFIGGIKLLKNERFYSRLSAVRKMEVVNFIVAHNYSIDNIKAYYHIS